LVDGDVKLAQSSAILRYLARKGGLSGDTDAAYAVSEMFIEEVSFQNSILIAHVKVND
jgi:glutathione S-transferase